MALKSLFSNLQRWLKALFPENEIPHHPKSTQLAQDKKWKSQSISPLILKVDNEVYHCGKNIIYVKIKALFLYFKVN